MNPNYTELNNSYSFPAVKAVYTDEDLASLLPDEPDEVEEKKQQLKFQFPTMNE
jgi:hypothetical protein